MQREGICALGNMIVDLLFEVERYPGLGELSAIRGARGMSAGGLACNIPLDLARLDGSLPIQACGVLGDDAEGDYLRAQFSQFENIDTGRILPGAQTDYTLVINDAQTRERTFFSYCGSSGLLDADSLDLSALPARILHAGSIILLEGLDRSDEEHGTQMAKLLRRAQRLGMRTSVDVVSETDDPFTRLPVAERMDVLDLVVRLAGHVQVVLLTADPVVARWAQDRSRNADVVLYEVQRDPAPARAERHLDAPLLSEPVPVPNPILVEIY